MRARQLPLRHGHFPHNAARVAGAVGAAQCFLHGGHEDRNRRAVTRADPPIRAVGRVARALWAQSDGPAAPAHACLPLLARASPSPLSLGHAPPPAGARPGRGPCRPLALFGQFACLAVGPAFAAGAVLLAAAGAVLAFLVQAVDEHSPHGLARIAGLCSPPSVVFQPRQAAFLVPLYPVAQRPRRCAVPAGDFVLGSPPLGLGLLFKLGRNGQYPDIDGVGPHFFDRLVERIQVRRLFCHAVQASGLGLTSRVSCN